MEHHTPKLFVLQLGAFIALYVSLTALITLAFGTIDRALPDEAEGYYAYESAQNAIRYGIALLVVFFPAYLILTRSVNRLRRRGTGGYLQLTRWLLYLSLLVGGGILLGDAVAVILGYLNGELTSRFIAKAAVLFVVIGAPVSYYVLEARGYWDERQSLSLGIGVLATILVLGGVALGLYYADSPQTARELRLDRQQITDLESIQWRIERHLFTEGELPQTLDVAFGGEPIPNAPTSRSAYEYERIDERTFELCATFAQPSDARFDAVQRPVRPADTGPVGIVNPHDWHHDAGHWCFTRTVTHENN